MLEVHLFDLAEDLYGRSLNIALSGWIRSELKFTAVGDLARRMDEDNRLVRRCLRAGDVFPRLVAFATPAESRGWRARFADNGTLYRGPQSGNVVS